MENLHTSLLNNIFFPSDLRKLKEDNLVQVSNDLRQFIIDIVSTNPGHFGASLGVVELTVALHYVFNTPFDRIVWDVGHQAYGHKILTGRREKFNTLRKFGGISGFPNRFESEYDPFTVGHASTSISSALGLAVAAFQQGEKNKHIVAVIGDGSLTGGLAFEGLNNAGIQRSNLLIILNDNHMAIDPNVGAMNEYLLDITTSKTYNRVRDEVWKILGRSKRFGPNSQAFIQKLESGIKTVMMKQSNLFEALNLRYFGPVDGHDVVYLTRILKDLKDIPGPKLLHVLTTKGKGFKQAELDQTGWHAPGLFDKDTGEKISIKSDKPTPPRFQDVFGITLVELAEKNPKIVGVTPAMPTGCSMNLLMEKFPGRAYDVGIAEQHAVTFSAGLAAEGLIPFCNIYSSFMQRAYDQVIHDVALQKLQIVICMDRGGIVGDDGATHHGAFDLAFMRIIPGLIISAPMDEEDLRNLMFTAQADNNGPFVIRYPRGNGIMVDWKKQFKKLDIGKGRILKEGSGLAIISIGTAGNMATEARKRLEKEEIKIAHYDMRFLKPIDEEILHEVFKKFDKIITVEDGTIVGGLGSAILEFMSVNGYSAQIRRLGIPDEFIEHGTQSELYKLCGYDAEAIYVAVKEMLDNKMAIKSKKTDKRLILI